MRDDLQRCLITTIQPLIQKIEQHPVFDSIQSITDLQRFMEIHVFTVWSLMCLAKALQRHFTCSHVLWLPPTDYLSCRLLHEIILELESGQMHDGRYINHFDWYLEAMQQYGANTQTIERFIKAIRHHVPLDIIFKTYGIPKAAIDFMRTTLSLIQRPAYAITSVFAYGWQNIIENKLSLVLKQLAEKQTQANIDLFIAYLQRCINLSMGKTSQQRKVLIAKLCDNDANKWREATDGTVIALKSYLKLLDSIQDYMEN